MNKMNLGLDRKTIEQLIWIVGLHGAYGGQIWLMTTQTSHSLLSSTGHVNIEYCSDIVQRECCLSMFKRPYYSPSVHFVCNAYLTNPHNMPFVINLQHFLHQFLLCTKQLKIAK